MVAWRERGQATGLQDADLPHSPRLRRGGRRRRWHGGSGAGHGTTRYTNLPLKSIEFGLPVFLKLGSTRNEAAKILAITLPIVAAILASVVFAFFVKEKEKTSTKGISVVYDTQIHDPFAEANVEDVVAGLGAKDFVHVRIQQCNGRKSLTTKIFSHLIDLIISARLGLQGTSSRSTASKLLTNDCTQKYHISCASR